MKMVRYIIIAFLIASTALWVDAQVSSTNLMAGIDPINILKKEILECRKLLKDKDNEIQDLKLMLSETNAYQIYICEVTAYSLTIEQVGNDPSNTALMEPPRVGGVAVSRDLQWMLGTKIKIDGVGIYRVNDLMAKTLKDGTPITQRIDIYMGKGDNAYKKAINWGIKTKKIIVITGKE